MKSIVLKFGLISGAILAVLLIGSIPLAMNGVIDFEITEVIGYTSMILAYLMVFVGIRTYRERVGGGAVTFARAFKVGILITLITSIVFVITWQIVYHAFIPDFADKYTVFTMEKLRKEGASAAELEKARTQAETFKRLYANPLINVGITFLEVFPVGLIITLISAAILRKKAEPGMHASAMATR